MAFPTSLPFIHLHECERGCSIPSSRIHFWSQRLLNLSRRFNACALFTWTSPHMHPTSLPRFLHFRNRIIVEQKPDDEIL
jgi:hypothetical protein